MNEAKRRGCQVCTRFRLLEIFRRQTRPTRTDRMGDGAIVASGARVTAQSGMTYRTFRIACTIGNYNGAYFWYAAACQWQIHKEANDGFAAHLELCKTRWRRMGT